MALALYIMIAWFVVMMLISISKKEDVVRHIFLYMTISLAVTNFFTIVIMRFQLIICSSQTTLAMSGLLYRNFIIPISIIVFLHIFNKSRSKKNKWLAYIFVQLFLNGTILLCQNLNIIQYNKFWNAYLSLLMFLFFSIIGIFLNHFFNKIPGGSEV